ncbi:hypothetical protein VPH35_047120 [Triticum aestivum]
MATTAATPDRLSELPDDLLIRILSFAPAREAASTTALSRRWRRPLWLDTGAVNLDYRSYATGVGGGDTLRRRMLDDMINANLAFLGSRGHGPNKFTLVVSYGTGFTTRDDDTLQAACSPEDDDEKLEEEEEESASLDEDVCILTGYSLQPCPDLTFPCLEAMRLRRCRTDYATLQDMISAAPKLADVRLEDVRFVNSQLEYQIRIRCPAATVIFMANCNFGYLNFDACRVELDAPRLRRFCYTVEVHLALHSPAAWPRSRSMLYSIYHVRVLKLTVYSMADLAVVAGAMSVTFYKLERLEIEELCGWSIQNNGVAAVRAVVSLLRCCTVVRELRFKFRWLEYLEEMAEPDRLAVMSDFSLCRSINAGHHDDEGCCYDLGLHGLCCGCTLECLRNSLRRVVVKFDAEELTCFQVRLIKFLAENAMVLEEFVVDGGKGYDSSRIRRKVARWQKRRPPSSPLPPKTPVPLVVRVPAARQCP